jgi:hypothetical protein
MEFYLSFHELLGRGGNGLAIIFLPLFLVMTVLEGLVILYRQGTYPGRMPAYRCSSPSAISLPKPQCTD